MHWSLWVGALVLALSCGEKSDPGTVADVLLLDDVAQMPAQDATKGTGTTTPDGKPGVNADAGGTEDQDGKTAENPCRDDECYVEETCYGNEVPNPNNPCELCLVIANAEAWTANDAAQCDDSDACTTIDGCVGGKCVGADRIDCNDGNLCTDDSCLGGECISTPNQAPCQDDDPCTLAPVCSAGVCSKGNHQNSCDDGNTCTIDTCIPLQGCNHVPADLSVCNDGNVCTVEDSCTAGQCGGKPRDCNDNNVCTVDACEPGNACTYTPVDVLCNDDNPCTDVSCQPEQGCVYSFNTASCNDDNACTNQDGCAGGACLGTKIDPNDGNLCTNDYCNPASGPVYKPNAKACDDGNECTLGDVCKDGDCSAGAVPLDCDDNDVCTTDLCFQGKGCIHNLNAAPCDDGSVCTQVDICEKGKCKGTQPIQCDDGNACTNDTCNAVKGCKSTLIAVASCRPEIVVNYPPRAATIQGEPGTQTVIVSGTVESGAGPVKSLKINGNLVDLVDGTFSFPLTPGVSGNTLILFATDSFGSVRKRVQSFLWSTAYNKPVLAQPKSGMVDPGLGIWLSKAVLNKLATALGPLTESLNLAAAIENPVFSGSGYKVYINNLTHSTPKLILEPQQGGLKLTVIITSVKADIDAPGKCEQCVFGLCIDLCPDFDGDLKISSVVATANVNLSVENHALKAKVTSVNVNVSGADVDIDGVIGFIIDPVLDNVVDDLIKDVEKSIAKSAGKEVQPAIENALGALAFESKFDMPSLDPAGATVPVQLKTDFSAVNFDPSGGVFKLRAGAYAPPVTPHINKGSLARVGCNQAPQAMVIPKEDPFEIVLADDTINEILYAAWIGGLLEFDVPPEMLSSADLSTYGISDLSVSVSGMTAPTLSDCLTGALELHIGDLKILVDLTLLGSPMTVEMYISLTAGFEIKVVDGEITLGLTEVKTLESEITVLQDDLIGSEKLIAQMINDNLVPSLLGALSGGALGGIPLPEIDLGGGAVLTIAPNSVVRLDGNTVIGGELK